MGSSDVDVAGGLAGLRRVAFLLERQLAPTYRVRAFRAAAATLDREKLEAALVYLRAKKEKEEYLLTHPPKIVDPSK